jgi:hypothetical protein
MNIVFAINFRREAYQRELAKTRRRALQLGLWVLYFGGLGVVLGLYGLNSVSLAQRTARIERQAERMLRHPGAADWRPGRVEAVEIERHLRSTRQWRARLGRLPELLPVHARLQSLEFNPDNVSGAADVKLVIAGEIRGAGGQDRLQQVMALSRALSRDSVFAAGFHNVRLVTTRTSSGPDGAEFVIECR